MDKKVMALRQAMITEAHRVINNFISDVVIDFMMINKLVPFGGVHYWILRKNGTHIVSIEEIEPTIAITGFEEIWKIDLDMLKNYDAEQHYCCIKKDKVMTLYRINK